jgi:hypothetical protein
MEVIMSDHQQAASRDRKRVNLDEPYEVQFWMIEFNCTEEQLRDAVHEHGDTVEALRAALKKQPAANIMEWD